MYVSALLTQTTVWDGVEVSPLDIAFEEKQAEKEGENEDMDADGASEEAMETAEN